MQSVLNIFCFICKVSLIIFCFICRTMKKYKLTKGSVRTNIMDHRGFVCYKARPRPGPRLRRPL